MVLDAGAQLGEGDHFILRINVMNVESVDTMPGIVPDIIRDRGAGMFRFISEYLFCVNV